MAKLTSKLTEKQQKLLDKMFEFGGWMSRKHIATYHSVSVADTLVKKGMLELTDTRNYKLTYEGGAALTVSKPAAIAANVSADAAPAWTPAVGDSVRVKVTKEVGTVKAIDVSVMGVEYNVYSLVDENGEPILDNQECDFMLREIEPAPDAAQTAAAGDAVTVASIQAKLDAIEWTDTDSGRVIIAKVEQLTDGIGCEWFFKDTGLWLDFEKLGNTLEDAMHKVVTMINTDDRKVDPKDAQIAQLTRDLEAARTEAAALRRFYDLACNLDLNNDMKDICHAQGKELEIEYIQLMADFDNLGIKWEPEKMALYHLIAVGQRNPDAALVSARQRADSGARTSADDVLAMFADDDAATLATEEHKPFERGTKVRVKYGVTNFTGWVDDYDPVEDEYYVKTVTGGRWAMSDTVTPITEAQS